MKSEKSVVRARRQFLRLIGLMVPAVATVAIGYIPPIRSASLQIEGGPESKTAPRGLSKARFV